MDIQQEITEEDRRVVAARLLAEQRARFDGVRKAAYTAAGVNPATWARATSGERVRPDRLVLIVKSLWPESRGDWDLVPDNNFSESERDEWGAILRETFAVSGLSERAVSEQARVSRDSLSSLLGRHGLPPAGVIEALRRLFELPADLAAARAETAQRRARPDATPTIYWTPEPGSDDAKELVTWGHMEDRFAELDSRIARIEKAVINLSNAVDRIDPRAQNAAALRMRRLGEEAAARSRELRSDPHDNFGSAMAADDEGDFIEEQEDRHDT